MGYRIFSAKKHGLIGVVTPENILWQLSIKDRALVNRGRLATNKDVCYVMELGSYWGLFIGRGDWDMLQLIDPDSLATCGEFPIVTTIFPRSLVGITLESCIVWKEAEMLTEISLKNLQVIRNIDISQRIVRENLNLSISLNAQVAAVVMEDEGATVWDLRTDETIYHDEKWLPGQLLLNPQGTHLALGTHEGRGAFIVDLRKGVTNETEFEDGKPSVLEWSLSGNLLAIDLARRYACGVWNTQGEKVAYHKFTQDIQSVAWISEEDLALVFEGESYVKGAKPKADFQIYLWNVRKAKDPQQIYPP